ncbi:hypothetical protein [Amycolatopsis jejuensis]|uniref:hypothetical protein n=1 Tax=Amycolatopsis jejuensis TaxID=330084 RepID=UPI000B308A24|nr:hypothetical protein [Amycolatopsis jejuensis]
MSTPARHRGALAAVRGGLLALSSASLAVTAHAAADGGLPDPALTLLLTGLIGWTATALAGRARGRLGTIAVLGGGQLVMHLVLTTLASHGEHASGWEMTAAHAVATLVTALVLARADATLLAVLHLLRVILPALVKPLPVPAGVPGVARPRPSGPGPLLDVELRRIHRRRGPPAPS